MADVTYYVALSFGAASDGPESREAVECTSAKAAIGGAERMARTEGHIGAIAFSRTGDPEFADAVLLKAFGEAPSDLSAALAAFCCTNGSSAIRGRSLEPTSPFMLQIASRFFDRSNRVHSHTFAHRSTSQRNLPAPTGAPTSLKGYPHEHCYRSRGLPPLCPLS
jgi:hypothetical protein